MTLLLQKKRDIINVALHVAWRHGVTSGRNINDEGGDGVCVCILLLTFM
jgi:hypothetical protein